MANVNPGPATTSNPNSLLTLVPVNTQTNSNPLLSNATRILAEYRGVNFAVAGDYPMPVFNSQRFVPTTIWYAVNSATTTAASATFASAASIGVYTVTGGTGTAIVTAVAGPTLGAALTSVTTGTVIQTTAITASIVYFRVATAVTTNCYFDVFLSGVDLT
jgi:hypothetical protein